MNIPYIFLCNTLGVVFYHLWKMMLQNHLLLQSEVYLQKFIVPIELMKKYKKEKYSIEEVVQFQKRIIHTISDANEYIRMNKNPI